MYSRNAFLIQHLKRTWHHLDKRSWESPCLSDICIAISIMGASPGHAGSNGRGPGQCHAALLCSLAEALRHGRLLKAEQFQLGNGLIFARLGRRQCHFLSPLEPLRLLCCVLWSWMWGSACTLNVWGCSASLSCRLSACPAWVTALARWCRCICCLLH